MLSKGRSCLLGLECWLDISLVFKGEVFYDVDEGVAEKSGDESIVMLSSSDVRLFCRKFSEIKLRLERRGLLIVVVSDEETDLNEECSSRDSWILVLNSLFFLVFYVVVLMGVC